MLNVSRHTYCAARLKFQRADMNDPAFTKYWAAVNIATDLDDDQLTEFCGFDFKDRSDENGERLLGRLEQFIRAGLPHRKKAKSDVNGISEAENSVRAFLGANGVKVSKLSGLEDYWKAATTLWPSQIETKPKVRDIYTLRFQISKISKKQRSSQARAHLSTLPAGWIARKA